MERLEASGAVGLTHRIQGEQLRLLNRDAPATLIANFAMALGAALALWTEVGPARAGLWVWLVIALSAARMATWVVYSRNSTHSRSEARRWMFFFVTGAGLSGSAWTAIVVMLFPTGLVPQLFLGAALAAITAATLSSLAHHRVAFGVFAVPTLAPYAAAMAVAGGATRVLVAAAIMTYLTCLMLIARNKERSVVGTLSLQLQNVDLVASLTEARDTAVSAMRQAENANLAMAEMITELDRSRREAEEANRSKSRFLAVMSHELRTPLNAIIGFSDIMTTQVLGPVGNPRYLEYAADIRTSGLHLLALINNVLDLSKVEAGKFELFEEEVQIAAVVATAVKLVSRQASEHGILMEVAVDPEIIIRADERAMKQIAINLLSNAVKFCRDGGRVRVAADSTEEGGLKLSVSDTGIGIAAKNVERALTPFSQIDEPVTRKSHRQRSRTGAGEIADGAAWRTLGHRQRRRQRHDRAVPVSAVPGRGPQGRLSPSAQNPAARGLNRLSDDFATT